MQGKEEKEEKELRWVSLFPRNRLILVFLDLTLECAHERSW